VGSLYFFEPYLDKTRNTLDFLGLELGIKFSGDDHKNRQQDPKQVDNDEPDLFTIVVSKYVSNDKGNSQKEDEKDEQPMDGEPNPLEILRVFFELNESPADLINDGGEVKVIGVALHVHEGSNAVIQCEYTVGYHILKITD
jgi:hypothetical protein